MGRLKVEGHRHISERMSDLAGPTRHTWPTRIFIDELLMKVSSVVYRMFIFTSRARLRLALNEKARP